MKDLQKYVAECESELKSIGIKQGIVKEWVINTRASSWLGQCKRLQDGTFQISIIEALLFDDVDVSLFERDKNMIDVFDKFETGKTVQRFDFLRDNINVKADLVMSNYVFSELTEEGRKLALEKMLNCSNNYVLIVDTGTPRTYENFMIIKKIVFDMGCKVIAPCQSEKCGLKNDYCQFFARVERSSLLKLSKSAELSFEDEKYFYLLISKNDAINTEFEKRVIRRPQIKTNFIELRLCSNDGISDEKFTKKDKESYKQAKKIKINELM